MNRAVFGEYPPSRRFVGLCVDPPGRISTHSDRDTQAWAERYGRDLENISIHPPRIWNHLGRAYFVARRYAEAVEAFKRIAAPDQFHHAFLAACYAQFGDTTAAYNHLREILSRNPGFSRSTTLLPILHYKRDRDLAHHRNCAVKAGLPM
ncbi:MAG: hypothetical protein WAO95_20400 [Burkholderiales bacterium]